jgi:hypothetical protein
MTVARRILWLFCALWLGGEAIVIGVRLAVWHIPLSTEQQMLAVPAAFFAMSFMALHFYEEAKR